MSNAGSPPVVEVRTMNPRTARAFERAFLTCPNGHHVGSTPLTSRHARKWLAGDFTEWDCGYGRCDWSGDPQ